MTNARKIFEILEDSREAAILEIAERGRLSYGTAYMTLERARLYGLVVRRKEFGESYRYRLTKSGVKRLRWYRRH